MIKDSLTATPFETHDLRAQLQNFLDTEFTDEFGDTRKIGDYKWGVYAFFDYDGEPIYVGQTNEKIRVRIQRHLTNQRTDAVAMSVLDPFEVFEVEVWPLPAFENQDGKDKAAKKHLDALEHLITELSVNASQFKAILNEKGAPPATIDVTPPNSFRGKIVSDRVYEIRSHPDFRIARRAQVMARLAQVISERRVQVGLRRVLLTQAKRLQWLAERRFNATGAKGPSRRAKGM